MNQTPEMDEKKTSSPETAPIAATAEHNANFEENIRAIIRSGKPASVIRDDLDNYHANDIAEVLETLDTATRKRLYNILSLEMTAEIFTYLDEPAPYLHELGLDRAAAVLAEMDADEAVDILENLDPEEKEALIARMDQESKDDIHLIFSYDEEQIGSRMTTNYIVIPNNCTIKQAMRHLISQAEDNDNIDTIYVEDENGRYFGAIELKDLITAREYMKLEDIISTSYPYVYADERSSDCMEELIDYSEDSIPVLDRNHKIIGAITYEDIAEAIEDVTVTYEPRDPGDLANLFHMPESMCDDTKADVSGYRNNVTIHYDSATDDGNIAHISAVQAPDPRRIAIYRDSFGTALLAGLPKYFAYTDFYHWQVFEPEFLNENKPDVLVYEVVERDLGRMMEDLEKLMPNQ